MKISLETVYLTSGKDGKRLQKVGKGEKRWKKAGKDENRRQLYWRTRVLMWCRGVWSLTVGSPIYAERSVLSLSIVSVCVVAGLSEASCGEDKY